MQCLPPTTHAAAPIWAEHVLQRKLCLTQPAYSSQALRLTEEEEEGWIPTPAALVRQPD
jgi:hypothetical protein